MELTSDERKLVCEALAAYRTVLVLAATSLSRTTEDEENPSLYEARIRLEYKCALMAHLQNKIYPP